METFGFDMRVETFRFAVRAQPLSSQKCLLLIFIDFFTH